VAFSPDVGTLATVLNEVVLWDAATHKERGVLRTGKDQTYALAFSPDGKTLATGGTRDGEARGGRGIVRLWEVTTGKPLGEPLWHPEAVTHVAFNPDGTILATAAKQSVRFWDAATGKAIGEPLPRPEMAEFNERGDSHYMNTELRFSA